MQIRTRLVMKYANVALFVVIVILVAYLYIPKKEMAIPPLISRGQDLQEFLSDLYLANGVRLENSSCRVILVMKDSVAKRAAFLRKQFGEGLQRDQAVGKKVLILYDPLNVGEEHLEQSGELIVLVPDSGFSAARRIGVRKEATFILLPGKSTVAESYDFVINHQILLERMNR